jgi:hypothetical protein
LNYFRSAHTTTDMHLTCHSTSWPPQSLAESHPLVSSPDKLVEAWCRFLTLCHASHSTDSHLYNIIGGIAGGGRVGGDHRLRDRARAVNLTF